MDWATQDLTSGRIQRRYNRRMRCQVASTALCAVVLLTPLGAQMRGSSRGSASMGMGHGTFSAQPSAGFRGAPAFRTTPGFGPSFGSGFPNRRPRFGTSFSTGFRPPFVSPRRCVRRGFFSTFSPFYGGYYGYPAYYSEDSYSTLDAYPAYDYYAAYAAQSSHDLAAQQQDIERLEDEVARLREERESPKAAQPKQSVELPSTPTLLVFRDKHTQEVQNYAVVGGTLWIFSERRATKLPLSWLDIEATAKANDERGVDFRLPN